MHFVCALERDGERDSAAERPQQSAPSILVALRFSRHADRRRQQHQPSDCSLGKHGPTTHVWPASSIAAATATAGRSSPRSFKGSWAADPSVQVTMRDADKKGRFRVTEF